MHKPHPSLDTYYGSSYLSGAGQAISPTSRGKKFCKFDGIMVQINIIHTPVNFILCHMKNLGVKSSIILEKEEQLFKSLTY